MALSPESTVQMQTRQFVTLLGSTALIVGTVVATYVAQSAKLDTIAAVTTELKRDNADIHKTLDPIAWQHQQEAVMRAIMAKPDLTSAVKR